MPEEFSEYKASIMRAKQQKKLESNVQMATITKEMLEVFQDCDFIPCKFLSL